MRIMLIHPPLDDPTVPYHSTAYLAGSLKKHGFTDVRLRDINIEFVNYCLEEKTINAMYEEVTRRLAKLTGKATLSYSEQEQYLALLSANQIPASHLKSAVETLRDRQRFLKFDLYKKSVRSIVSYFDCLGALSYPAEITNMVQGTQGRFSINNFDDLFDHGINEMVCFPFSRFVAERLASDPIFGSTDLFGISIVYNHQLTHALHLARSLKQYWPSKDVILGGTTISQMYKYAKDTSSLAQLGEFCDAVVIGEGERAICEIAAYAGRLDESSGLTNTIVFGREGHQASLSQPIRYENLNQIGSPIYDLPWESYLSPERGVNYSPTRGCYWNRCTFCDYGLNTDSPTSPWRERDVDLVIEDLKQIQAEWDVNYVYFAVDVMAPAYLDRLSKAIVAAGLNLSWSTELRMERVYSIDRCDTMARAGCVAVSFGMESGSQRILDLIDKGTKVSYMAETMKNFSQVGIAVQLMAFQGFPTESAEDRNETYNFIEQNSMHCSTGGMGTFQLTGTSMVAKDPEKFGIKVVDTEHADLTRSLLYQEEEGEIRNGMLSEEYDASFNDTNGIFPEVLGRPWAGGIDSLHSIIYYRERGRHSFRSLDAAPDGAKRTIQNSSEALHAYTIEINGALVDSQYDVAEILKHQILFHQYLQTQTRARREPTYSGFEEAQKGIPAIARSEPRAYWITSNHGSVRIDKAIYEYLAVISTHGIPVSRAVAGVRADVKQGLFSYLDALMERDFISLVSIPER